MGGVSGKTGTYVRTPEMLRNYSEAAKHRRYTIEGRAKLRKRQLRVLARDGHPCLGKHWKLSKKVLAKRSLRPGNHTGHKHSEETKRLLRKATIKGRLKQARSKIPTAIESKVYKYLKFKGVQFKKQYPIGSRYIVDAYIISINFAIEVDGSYWHSTPRGIATDLRKDKFIKKLGIKLLRIPEAAVHNGCFKKIIKSILKGADYEII